MLVSRAVSFLFGITSIILLSRILGPSGLGKFRLGSVIVQILTTFCVLGLDRGLLRYVPILGARGEGGSRTLLVRSSCLVIGISVALSLALLLAAPALATHYFHSPGMANIMRVFSLQIPVLALFRFLSGAATAVKRFDFASKITNILSPAVFLFLLALIGLVFPNVYATIAVRIIAQVAAVACLGVFVIRHYQKPPRVESTASDTFKSYLLLSIPLFLIGIGYQLLNQMDTIMLGHFVSEKDVGIYSIAFKASALILIGLEILLPIVAPLFSQFSESRDTQSTEALFGTVTKWLCYSGLLIFACIAIFRVELLHLFGKGFTSGSSILLVLAVGQLANAATGPTGMLLSMTGRQKWELANIISMVAFNFLLNLILIPRMGTIGAAIATAISIAAINGFKLVQVYVLFGLRAYNLHYLKGVLAIGGAGAVGYLFRGWLFDFGFSFYAIIFLGERGFTFALYGVFLFWLKGKDELGMLGLRGF